MRRRRIGGTTRLARGGTGGATGAGGVIGRSVGASFDGVAGVSFDGAAGVATLAAGACGGAAGGFGASVPVALACTVGFCCTGTSVMRGFSGGGGVVSTRKPPER